MGKQLQNCIERKKLQTKKKQGSKKTEGGVSLFLGENLLRARLTVNRAGVATWAAGGAAIGHSFQPTQSTQETHGHTDSAEGGLQKNKTTV